MMESRAIVLISKCAALGLVALALSGMNPARADEHGDGQQLYESRGCFQCHGYLGQGGSAGPRLAPVPIPLSAFIAIVRKPPNVMPAYSPNVLSDDELRKIYQFSIGTQYQKSF